jgi:hypothetical protein
MRRNQTKAELSGWSEPGQLAIEIRERSFEHLPVPGILGAGQSRNHRFPGQQQPVPHMLPLLLLRGELRLQRGRTGNCLSLLVFDRFTLPASSHSWIIYKNSSGGSLLNLAMNRARRISQRIDGFNPGQK